MVSANNINAGQRKVRGVDFALTYHVPRKRWGQFSLLGGATYIDEFLTRLDTSAPLLDLAGTFRDEASEGLGGIPQWKGQLNLRWSGERWRSNYQIHFVGKMKEVIPESTQTRDIKSWIVHDLQFGYKFDVLDGLRWTMGVDNLLDETAPLATSAFNDNIDGRTHELKGRFWYTKLSQRF